MDRKLPRCRARFHGYRAGCQGRMISFPAMTAVPNCPACTQNTAIYLADASELSYFWSTAVSVDISGASTRSSPR